MSHFLETICIRDGVIQHLEWHQNRVNATLQHFYPGHKHAWSLENSIDIPSEFQSGVIRCRIIYDAHLLSIHYFAYEIRSIKSLNLIDVAPAFDYRYKYADRMGLDELFAQRGEADDILILRNGWITDTSVSNIAFSKNNTWYSPSAPLLAGTTWKRLVSSGILTICPIHWTQLSFFDTFKLFNSMNDWDTGIALPIHNIRKLSV